MSETTRERQREAFRVIDLSKDNLLFPAGGSNMLLTSEQHHELGCETNRKPVVREPD